MSHDEPQSPDLELNSAAEDAPDVVNDAPPAEPAHEPQPAPVVHDPERGAELLCQRLHYTFQDAALLLEALTHPSWRNEHAPGLPDNQRLEFLGDAVLGLLITQELVQRLPERREGELTVLKSQLVRESSLAALADGLGLGAALRLGRGESQTGGRQRPSVLADALEAVVGALFLDAGFERTREIVLQFFGEAVVEVIARTRGFGEPSALSASTSNWKTAVQEILQHLGLHPPTYSSAGEEGPVHARHFRVRAATVVAGEALEAEGEGASKKIAEHDAAAGLYRVLQQKLGFARPQAVDGALPGHEIDS